MRNDFEQLLWLYSIGVEQVGARQPTNYSEVKIVKKINEAADQKQAQLLLLRDVSASGWTSHSLRGRRRTITNSTKTART